MKPRLPICNWILAALILACVVDSTLAEADASSPLRVLILSGDGKPEWRASVSFLEQTLLSCGRFDVRLCETPVGISTSMLSSFDVIVDDHNGSALGTETEKA